MRLIAALLICTLPAYGANSQTCTTTTPTDDGGTAGSTYTLSVVFVAGKAMVVFAKAHSSCGGGSLTATVANDGTANTYVQVLGTSNAGLEQAGSGMCQWAWAVSSLAASATQTVTVTFSGSVSFRAMGAVQIANSATSPVDVKLWGSAASTTHVQLGTLATPATPAALSLAQANETVVQIMSNRNFANTIQNGTNNGAIWTVGAQSTNHILGVGCYVLTTATPGTPDFVASASTNFLDNFVVSFKEVSTTKKRFMSVSQ